MKGVDAEVDCRRDGRAFAALRTVAHDKGDLYMRTRSASHFFCLGRRSVGLIALPSQRRRGAAGFWPAPSRARRGAIPRQAVATGSPNPIGAAYENLRLGVRVRSQFANNNETTSVVLRFDDDIKVNMATVPGICTADQLERRLLAAAYAQCGPGPVAATPICRRPAT